MRTMSGAMKSGTKSAPRMQEAKGDFRAITAGSKALVGDRRPGPRSMPRPVAGSAAVLTKRLHDVNSGLGAMRLRFGLVLRDPRCRWAHEENLEAIAELLAETAALVARAQDVASNPAPISAPQSIVVRSRG